MPGQPKCQPSRERPVRLMIASLLLLLLAPLSRAQPQLPQGPAPAPATASQAGNGTASGASARTQAIDPAKEADIRRLLDVAGTTTLMTEVMKNMTGNLRTTLARALPPGDNRAKLIDLFVDKFTARATVEFPKLVDAMIPIYDQYFTDDEIKGLIDFYQTPLGKKTISVLPKITIEMQNKGQQLGERIGRESMQEVLTEHPELAPGAQGAKPTPAQ